jgi:hypothetical protein
MLILWLHEQTHLQFSSRNNTVWGTRPNELHQEPVNDSSCLKTGYTRLCLKDCVKVKIQITHHGKLVLVIDQLNLGGLSTNTLHHGIHDAEEERRAQDQGEHGAIRCRKLGRLWEGSQHLESTIRPRVVITMSLQLKKQIV